MSGDITLLLFSAGDILHFSPCLHLLSSDNCDPYIFNNFVQPHYVIIYIFFPFSLFVAPYWMLAPLAFAKTTCAET